MKRASYWLRLALAAWICFALGQLSGQANTPSAARCQISVPPDWGEFIGASNYGVAFRDDQGTIRFFSQMPCGLGGKPNLSLEIRRQ